MEVEAAAQPGKPERPAYSGVAVMREESLPGLEKFFLALSTENSHETLFDLPIALSILRLYNFYPRNIKENVVLHILGMAFGVPAYEAVFLSCRYLLPDAIRESPAVQQLCVLNELLDTAQFNAFWLLWDALPAAPWKHAGLELKIRLVIIDVVARVYDSISLSLLSDLVHLSGKEFEGFLTQRGFEISGNIVKSVLGWLLSFACLLATAGLELCVCWTITSELHGMYIRIPR